MPYSPETMAELVLIHPRIPAELDRLVRAKMARRTIPTTRHRAKSKVTMGISAAAVEAFGDWTADPMAGASLIIRLVAQVIRASYEVPEGREEHEGDRLRDLGVGLRKVADKLREAE